MVWLNTVLGALRKPLPIFGGPHSAVLAIGAPLAAQKLTQRSASSPLSSLEKHFIAPPSYKTTSKYSKILRVHAVMGLQRQLIKRRSRGDVERAAAAHGQAQRPDLYTARFLVLWNSSSRLLAALFRAHLVSQQCIMNGEERRSDAVVPTTTMTQSGSREVVDSS